MSPFTTRLAFAASLTLAGGIASLRAQPSPSDDIAALRAQIQELDQKLRILERKGELAAETAATAATTAGRVTVNDRGLTIASPDAASSVRVRGLVQMDSRTYFDDGGINNNTFLLRRARLILEGLFAKNYSFQLVSELGGGNAAGATVPGIVDANIGINLTPRAQLKVGKFKVPVGLELLQSDSWTFFNERSVVTNLVPNRDLGVQVGGDLSENRVNYAIGVFGGVADAASTTNADFDEEKSAAGRIFFTPFRNRAGSPLQGLAFGVGGDVGRQKSASGRTGGYRTDGQQTFFSYLGTTVADGRTWRVSPQFDYRNGAFGALGEYVVSTVNVRPTATGAKAELQNKAWQLAAGYVLTGENSAPSGVVPATNFDFANGTKGAFEVVARYAKLENDPAAFPAFASAAASAQKAFSYGLGLNWYLSKSTRASFDYYHTEFGFHSSAPATLSTAALRQDENVFITRLQLTF